MTRIGASDSPQPPGTPAEAGSQGITILSAADVDAVLAQPATLERALAGQAAVFRAFSQSHTAASPPDPSLPPSVQMPQRIVTSSSSSRTLFMPSRIEAAGGTGIKIVSVPLKGGAGLPATTLVLDEQTGQVKGVINARRLTALRNACGSALFMQTAPKPREPKSLLIFGSGLQATTHADVFLRVFQTLRKVTFVGRKETPRLDAAVRGLKEAHKNIDVSCGVAPSPFDKSATDATEPTTFNLSQAVHDADVIITCTSSTVPLFRSVDVTSQSHVILIGSYQPTMHEVETNLIDRARKLVVDSEEGCAAEAGELIKAGVKRGDGRMVELGAALEQPELVAEDGPGDVFIYKSVGIGIQDIAIARMVMNEAEGLGLGLRLPDYDA